MGKISDWAETAMIDPSIILEIRRLLAEGQLSHRRIGLKCGVSRMTVFNISSGRRRDRPDRPSAWDDDRPLGPAERCPSCGGMVFTPCRLCRIRAQVAARRIAPVRRQSA
ncbi:MAG TPA: hypothetical protein VFE24_06310 [Pirellulales bacterium]|nr:hypothetical protein [Pirellulales bacterium]